MAVSQNPDSCMPVDSARPTRSPGLEAELVRIHQDIADLMQSIHQEIAETRALSPLRVTAGAVTYIPGAVHAAITLAPTRDELRSIGFTDAIALGVEQIQQCHREGPAMAAARDQYTCLAADLDSEVRWPKFTATATSTTPVRSVLSIPLSARSLGVASLNIYADTSAAFSPAAQHVAGVFATHAAIAIDAGCQVKHYRQALNRRDAIGQAKGMLMERFDVDASTAFALLGQLAVQHETSVAVTARQVVWHKLKISERSIPKAS